MSDKTHTLERLRQDVDEFERTRANGKAHYESVRAALLWLGDARRPLSVDSKVYVDAIHYARMLFDLLSVINSRLLIAQSDADIKRYALEFGIPPEKLYVSTSGVKVMKEGSEDV